MFASPPDHLRPAFDYLDTRYELLVETLRCWCDQNSGSDHRNGLEAMLEMLTQDFAELNVDTFREPTEPFSVIDDDGRVCKRQTTDLLIAQYQPSAARRMLLMIHYDTVYPPGSIPNRCILHDDGRMVGPGTADAKGGLLVMLEAMRVIRKFGLDQAADFGWTIVANPDEEIGSPGSSDWMRRHAGEYLAGLLFEPPLPDGSLVGSRKGSGNFSVIVQGRSAHAGRNITDGRNAIVHLSRLMAELDQLNRAGNGLTLNVAKIRGGTALNRVPDWAMGRFNIRVPDRAAGESSMRQVQRIIERYNTTEGFKVLFDGEFQSPPKPVDQPTELLQQIVERAGQIAGRDIRWRPTGGACDGSKLAAAGLCNIDTLGPSGDNLHSPAEWVDTHSLIPAIKTVIAVVDEISREGLPLH